MYSTIFNIVTFWLSTDPASNISIHVEPFDQSLEADMALPGSLITVVSSTPKEGSFKRCEKEKAPKGCVHG